MIITDIRNVYYFKIIYSYATLKINIIREIGSKVTINRFYNVFFSKVSRFPFLHQK